VEHGHLPKGTLFFRVIKVGFGSTEMKSKIVSHMSPFGYFTGDVGLIKLNSKFSD